MTIRQTFMGQTCLSEIHWQHNDSIPYRLIQVIASTLQIENNKCEKLLRVAIDAKL